MRVVALAPGRALFAGVVFALASVVCTPADAASAHPSKVTSSVRVGVFSGAVTKRTKSFAIRSGNLWVLHWRFNCTDVDNPAFTAIALGRATRDGAMSVTRDGRIDSSGTLDSAQTGVFSYRVVSDCPWRLTIDEGPAPVVPTDPFESPAMVDYLHGRSGDVTAALYDVGSGEIYLYRPDVTEQTASIVKVDILATLLWQEQTRQLPLDEDDLELATDMIEDSDNDDASALWDEVGGGAGVARFDSLAKLSETTPGTGGYWGETLTSALDQVELLKQLVLPGTLLDAASRAYELGLMEHVVGFEDWGVSSGPTPGTTVALKNGWLPLGGDDWQINSIGDVDGDGRDYLIAVLTTGDPTESYGIGTIEAMANIVWGDLAAR